jgi:hypothetical protein
MNRDHLGDPEIGRIILKWIQKKLGVSARTGFIWLKTMSAGRLFCTW